MAKKDKSKTTRTQAQKKRNISLFPIALILAICLAIYPMVSDLVLGQKQDAAISSYLGSKHESWKDYLKNTYSPKSTTIKDGFTKEESSTNEVDVTKESLTTVGVLSIPKIHQQLPIYNNTSDEALEAGTGLLEGTSALVGGPGRHSVITGHRGMSFAKQFTNLPSLKIGDKFYIKVNSEIHAYQVDRKVEVKPNDTSKLAPVPGKDYVTLVTCTPIFQNTRRLLVRGHRVKYNNEDTNQKMNLTWLLLLPVFVVISWISFALGKRSQRKSDETNKER